jgi:hypothetical protein
MLRNGVNQGRLSSVLAAAALVASVFVGTSLVSVTPAVAYICDDGAQGTDGDDNANKFNTACGQNSETFASPDPTGKGSAAYGNSAAAYALGSTAVGPFSQVDANAQDATAVGRTARVFDGAPRGLAVGFNANVNEDDGIAIGSHATTMGVNAIAVGTDSGAEGVDDSAFGARAMVTADHSTAIGADAVASMPNQMAFGTVNDTYFAPGITSPLSASRQSGPLQVVTTDANGNLASDGGAYIEGVAIALADHNPDLKGDEKFGLAINWGNFNGVSNAIAGSFMGVLHQGPNGRFALSGGIGVGLQNGTVGGHVGAQVTW